jgi:hypothetical protein
MIVSLLPCVFVPNLPHTTCPLPRASKAASSPLRAILAAVAVLFLVPGVGCSPSWA